MPISTIGQNGLQQSRILTAVQQPAGAVLQVVQTSYATPFSTTSSSYVSAGASATITPLFATSKILAQVSVACGNSAYNWQYVTLYRNSTTNIAAGSGNPAGYISNGTNVTDYLTTLNFQILDSPSTTSATTYTLYTKANGSQSIRCQVDAMPTYVTLMEIAA